MPPKSPKEQCFEDAVREYERLTGRDLNASFQQPWVRPPDGGKWQPDDRSWRHLLNSLMKTFRYLKGQSSESGTVEEFRFPDMTLRDAEGRYRVVDLKFTHDDGSVDVWHKGQEEAYAQINRQEHGDQAGAIALNPKSCGCRGAPQRERVQVSALSLAPDGHFYMVPLPPSGAIPSLPGIPGIPPIGMPAPLPIFP